MFGWFPIFGNTWFAEAGAAQLEQSCRLSTGGVTWTEEKRKKHQ